MRNLFCLLLLVLYSVNAKDLFVAQTAAGADDGSSAANAKSIAWMNTAGSWGAGASQIGTGDTVRLVGTITNQVTILGNGVTVAGQSGSALSAPYWDENGAVYLYALSDVTITNLVINATANGTALANQESGKGIYVAGTVSNIVISGCTITNLYQRTPDSEDPTTGIYGVYFGGASAGTVISSNWISCAKYGVYVSLPGGSTSTNIVIANNTIDDISTGIVIGSGNTSAICYGSVIENNQIGGVVTWDGTWDGGTSWHHGDGIHLWASHAGASITNVTVRGNLIGSDMGVHTSGWIFIEDRGYEDGMKDVFVYNNVLTSDATSFPSLGFIAMKGGTNGCENLWIANNTIIGTNHTALYLAQISTNTHVLNNVAVGVSYNVLTLVQTNLAECDYNVWADNDSQSRPFQLASVGKTFTEWKSLVGGDTHSSQSIPALDSSWKPTASSAIVDSGTTLPLFGTDAGGLSRPQGDAWDMGAYEYSVAPTSPAISSQPSSIYRQTGTAATFTITATGTAPLSYQWSKGASAITDATNATYTISAAALTDAGSYSCTVTNAYGSATSSAAVLSVDDVRPRGYIAPRQ